MESKGINVKQEKLDNERLGRFRYFIIGLAMPAKEQAGFIGVFGMTDDQCVLLDEFESPDIIKMVESLAWLIVKFSFRDAKYPRGDFIFGDEDDDDLVDLISRYGFKMSYSPLSFGKDEQKPFMTLLPKINHARHDGIIIIGDEMLLNRRLKDEALRTPANVQYGDSPPAEALCYAYFGWKELIRQSRIPLAPEKQESYNPLTYGL